MYLTFVTAVIIICKHATFLCLSNLSSQSALTQSEKDFQAANINLKIEEYLMALASSQEYTVEQFAHFIMATDIGLFIFVSIKNYILSSF